MMILPVNYFLDKKRFRRFGILYNEGIHLGHDFDVPYNFSVNACSDGIVLFVGKEVPGFGGRDPRRPGGIVIIEHYDYNANFICTALYGHMQIEIDVKPGDRVRMGKIIGYIDHYFVGKTDLPHLHFGINTEKGIPTGKLGYGSEIKNWIDPIKKIGSYVNV